MVATISALGSAGQASSYYELDDYYAEGGYAPSQWHGAGAQELGLEGPVERDTFRALLEGKLAGDQQLGRLSPLGRDGAVEHRPGWDVTLSAPKSVSIMAEVAGDRRLITAHDNAVRAALGFAERHGAATRIRTESIIARQQTGHLAIASFRHATSRAQDPQLHTHNVILNATRDAEGRWRSLEPRGLYQLQKSIGAVYRQELAHEVQALGYALAPGKDSLFEIKGVPAQVIIAFSERAAQVEARLAERGHTRATASAQEKQIAALDTRAIKVTVNRADLIRDWRQTADSATFDQTARQALVARAQTMAALDHHLPMLKAQGALAAHQAVAFAADTLSERQSVFAAAELEKEAGRFGLGTVTHGQIRAAIARAEHDGTLVARSFIDRRGASFAGFTTATNLATEQQLLSAEALGRGAVRPMLTPAQAAKAVARAALGAEQGWNDGQRAASRALLTSPNRVTALQGYAGTAKTTTVLASVAKVAAAQGYHVSALAPTASSARTLGDALGLHGKTVARHLVMPVANSQAGVWIVDEASLLSAHDTARLLDAATSADARIILVGDVKQLGSVGAGAAFAQLQAAGMQTATLHEIVRQTNPLTRAAVEASIAGDARRVLDALDRGGGRIIAHADHSARLEAMASDYAALPPAEQRRTLVIEPSRAGRDVLNAAIRARLIENGGLRDKAVTLRTLETKGLTRAEAKDARSYEAGDVICFARAYAAKGITRHEALTVTQTDPAKNAVLLARANGQIIDWRPRQWGASQSAAFSPNSAELRQGDRIQFTRNDPAQSRENGAFANVTAINPEARTARIRLERGTFQTLSLDTPADQHIRHGYAQTVYTAQGQTATRVLIHADSKATNLVDQKMLYVAISRAKTSAAVYTNDQGKLITAIKERAGKKQTAMASDTISTSLSKASQASKGAGMG